MKKEEITLKNAKAEILYALNAALEREKKLSTVKSNPEKEEEKKKIEKAIDNSKENVSKNIFSNELIQIFNDLEIAIKAEEEILKVYKKRLDTLNHLYNKNLGFTAKKYGTDVLEVNDDKIN